MAIYAIGDLHLGKASGKPMTIFGSAWENHVERLIASWLSVVNTDDIVLIPGDISWAMKLSDAYTDLEEIMCLPGKKIFIRGNHDYWWTSISKVRTAFEKNENAFFLQNDSVCIDEVTFCGTRGWLCPESAAFCADDERVYNRELTRMRISLESCNSAYPIVVLMHYPPFPENHKDTGFTDLFTAFNVSNVVYGHLHAKACRIALEGNKNGVIYTLCSADHVNFSPIPIDINRKN